MINKNQNRQNEVYLNCLEEWLEEVEDNQKQKEKEYIEMMSLYRSAQRKV